MDGVKKTADGRLIDSVRPGDRVTIINRFDQKSTGRAVMPAKGGIGWVLNMGGAHGTPGIATDENTVAVRHMNKPPALFGKCAAELALVAQELAGCSRKADAGDIDTFFNLNMFCQQANPDVKAEWHAAEHILAQAVQDSGFLLRNIVFKTLQEYKDELAACGLVLKRRVVSEALTGAYDPAKAQEIIARLPSMLISDIAFHVARDWGRVNFAAKPYLDAMFSMNKISDMYGMDSGESIVAYFLGNATSWRGEFAKAVKAELNKRLKSSR